MKLFRNCTRCKRIIKQGNKCSYCDNKTQKHYDNVKRNKERASFYHSKEWTDKRLYILNKYNYIDIYEYYTTGQIIQANLVHHIIPVEDNLEYILSDFNLFPVSSKNHNTIHNIYNKSEKDKKELQGLLFRWLVDFER